MKKIFLLAFCILFVLTGCSQKERPSEIPELLEVEIRTPETINVNEEVTIEVLITQGDEKVEETTRMEFEIWKAGEEEHEMIEGENKGNGIYSITRTFQEEGEYFVISHVTARDMHNMPKKEFTVTSNPN